VQAFGRCLSNLIKSYLFRLIDLAE